MPQLDRGEWEHLFEPWFEDEAPKTPAPKLQTKRPESIFSEASQPLAVRRQDFIERQSPVSRALQLRGGHVAAEMERLVAYAERRHHGVELTESERAERPPLRDAPLRRLATPPMAPPPATANELSTAPSAEARSSPQPSAGGSVRALLAFVAVALVGVYVVSVQRSATAALSRATAAERKATEVQQAAQDAVAAASDRAQRAISEALAQAARTEHMIEVIAAPDARRIDLAGSAAAPGAVGHALYSRSRGVIVSATGVPRPAGGHIYQVWAATSTGSVSLGLAFPDGHGRMAGAYELPRSLTDSIRGFVITQEPAGGSSSPTGRAVLTK